MANEELVVRALTEKSRTDVESLDEMSGNCVSQWLEDNEDYAWGLFKNNNLIGYCTIGYADDCGPEIENFKGYTHDSLLLSDVFIKPEYRKQGYALLMIDEAIRLRTANEKELIFLTVLYDDLRNLYEKCSFMYVKNGVMVRDERS